MITPLNMFIIFMTLFLSNTVMDYIKGDDSFSLFHTFMSTLVGWSLVCIALVGFGDM